MNDVTFLIHPAIKKRFQSEDLRISEKKKYRYFQVIDSVSTSADRQSQGEFSKRAIGEQSNVNCQRLWKRAVNL